MVDVDQEVDHASKEEGDGDVKKGREGLDSSWKTETLDTFGEEGPYPSTLVRGVPTL